MPWDPKDGTFGAYVRDKNLQVRPSGWTWRTRDQPLEDTPTRRSVRDQLGHVVTERTDASGTHRDVEINLGV